MGFVRRKLPTAPEQRQAFTMDQRLRGNRLLLAACLVTFLATGGLLTGCVERRFVITTDPPGAIVFDEKGQRMGGGQGAAPVDRAFTYYGEYQFTLVKDGYETQIVREKVGAPFYEWLLLDFFSENVIPWTIRDIRRFNYQLRPKQMVPPEVVIEKGNALRARGQAIGVPLPEPSPGPGPVTTTLMPPAP
jgi:hypothetical protein